MNGSLAGNHLGLIDLCQARVGARLRVHTLKGQPAVCHRLRELGFCERAEIEKVADNGALICRVCGARIALSRTLAREILVEMVGQ